MTEAAERIYYDAPEALEFTATVTAIREVARVDGRQVWQIALDRTAFYPESGGQPHDTGTLVAKARSGALLEVPVTAVEEDAAGEVWHTTAKPLQQDTPVHGTVDAARRRDHMQQHSGQHLLSAVLLRDLGLKTASFHLGAGTSTIDLDGPAADDEQLEWAVRTACRVVASALPVTTRYVQPEEAARMLREGALRKLPERAGVIRIVEMPGVDVNACGGTHVANTAEIGLILLRGSEKVRSLLRLHFVCGDRALEAAHADYALLRALGRDLSTGTDGVADAITRLQLENKAARKEKAALLQALAEAQASLLAPANAQVVTHTLTAPHDLAYARLLASRLVSHTEATVACISVEDGEQVAVVLVSKPGGVDCGAVLREALQAVGARGGGGRDMAQGAVSLTLWPVVADALRRSLG